MKFSRDITTWMNLENTMLSETSQTQKDTVYDSYLYEISRLDKFIETVNKSEVTRGWEEGEWGVIA